MATPIPLLSRFQGCIVGAVAGDCMGATTEHFWSSTPVKKIIEYNKSIKKEALLISKGAHSSKQGASTSGQEEAKNGFVLHTDDSCMTFDLGESLVNLNRFDPHDVSKRFTETYMGSSPQRFYGGSVGFVFYEFAKSNFTCGPWAPASQQFDGKGSYGNGGAMRVSPVTLYAHGNVEEIAKLAADQAKITHAHAHGYIGAILQALAIEKVMACGAITDTTKFCMELLKVLKSVVSDEFQMKIYEEKIQKAVDLLGLDRPVSADELEEKIGTGVTAPEAVPAAIFCFLYTLDGAKVPKLSPYNGLVRAILYSVAVCTDSDTVASMAGAIAGAYYGFDVIPPEWMIACEGADRALKLANDLYELNQANNV